MKTFTIGRNENNDYKIDNNTVSGNHAELQIADDFKTFVNDLKMQRNKYSDDDEKTNIEFSNQDKKQNVYINGKFISTE